MDDSLLLDTAYDFQKTFKRIFDHPAIGRSLEERFFNLKQGARTVAEFTRVLYHISGASLAGGGFQNSLPMSSQPRSTGRAVITRCRFVL